MPLSQVADVYSVGGLNRIVRYNQERTITVSAKNQVLKASEIFAALKPTLDGMTFPKDYKWAVFHQPNTKFPQRVASQLGFSMDQIEPGLLVGTIGNTYAGAAMIG